MSLKNKSKFNVCVVGAGAVGIEMVRCVKKLQFPVDNLKIFARSSREIEIDKEKYKVEAVSSDSFNNMDIAFFAGTEGEKGASLTYAKEAVKRNCIVIDNGADFRMDKDVPLVVVEVNPKDIKKHKGIIANPNCSTIQMAVALYPIYKKAGIKRIIVTTFQAVSGAGKASIIQLFEELKEILNNTKDIFNDSIFCNESEKFRAMPQQIAFNVFPHIGSFSDYGYTTEEWKLVKETHKIFGDNKIKISSTCVRVPVRSGHSEAVYIETKKYISSDKVKELLSKSKGVVLLDDIKNNIYPMPKDVEGKFEVFVGRIRNDPYTKNGLWLWVVADNLLKGAALNAVQIAQHLIS